MDLLNGGENIDTVTYAAAESGVGASLDGSAGSGGSAGDTLNGVENLIGFAFDDTLTGDSLDNRLVGGAGADILANGAGVDLGGYADEGAGVAVDLGLGTTGSEAAGDTLTGIENLIGTDFADTLSGDSLANSLEGSYRDNIVTGGAGDDTILGFGGDDRLDGGQGSDLMSGGTANESFLFDILDLSVFSTDIISDFNQGGDDVLDVSGLSLFASRAEVLATAFQQGADIAFDFDGDSHVDLVLQGNVLGSCVREDALSAGCKSLPCSVTKREAEGNCVAARRGGEQPEANRQPVG